jgi:N-acetylglucosaminyldiphosphoundecaprenol N-acetyl-beta-D-mannosaminyltransferase
MKQNFLLSKKIINSQINITSYEDVCNHIQHWVNNNLSCYIIAANVHVVMTGYWQPQYQDIINQAALVTPDGMPLVWAMRLLGIKEQSRVYGPDLMLAWCNHAAKNQIPIYLYGGTKTTLDKLQCRLKEVFPNLIIAGSHSPPFRPLTSTEEAADLERIQASGAKVVFVGLGCPKQEEWMNKHQGKLAVVMIGVGAAFRLHSGEISQAPRWMMGYGLEWVYRFAKEPCRLWKRYLVNNPAFVIIFTIQLVKHRIQNYFQ